MTKIKFNVRQKVKCIDCGFFGDREGGVDKDGSFYLSDKFCERHVDRRRESEFSDSHVAFSDDGNSWNVIGCYHKVWSLWGSNTEAEKEKAKEIMTEERHCKYYFPYQSGYAPAGHNEMVRDKKNRRMMLYVALINAGAIILAALITIIVTQLKG